VDGARTSSLSIEQSGFEITLLEVFSLRRGNWKNPDGDIDGDTSGWSVGVELDGLGGFRYDEASRPQATGLDDVDREAWLVHLDVLGIAQRLRDRY